MEISLENLYVDLGAYRVKVCWKAPGIRAKCLTAVLTRHLCKHATL